MPLVDIEEVESRCPFCRYSRDINVPQGGDVHEAVRLFWCLLLGEMLRDGEGRGPSFSNGACTLKCPVPKRLGEPEYDPTREPYIRRMYQVGLRANVAAGWSWNKANRRVSWSHEWAVAEATVELGQQAVRKHLDKAIIEGLDPVEARRLKDIYAPLDLGPV